MAQDCIGNFNFDRVHALMTLTGWVWGDLGRTPTVAELSTEAYRLLRLAYVSALSAPGLGYTACGGLNAHVDTVMGVVSLIFVLEENEVCAD